MSSAQNAVISAPELLELILSHLPMRDLLIIAPLVSKTWQSTTLTPCLQRALFFEPDLHQNAFETPSSHNYSDIQSMPWFKAPKAFQRPEASWRRMLVAQPPVQTMRITEECHAPGGGYRERHADLGDLSMRMGFLHDLTLPLIDRAASSFCDDAISVPEIGDEYQLAEDESDLILTVQTTQSSIGTQPLLDKELFSDARKDIPIEFGEAFISATLQLPLPSPSIASPLRSSVSTPPTRISHGSPPLPFRLLPHRRRVHDEEVRGETGGSPADDVEVGEERARAANTTNTCLPFVGFDDIECTTKELEGMRREEDARDSPCVGSNKRCRPQSSPFSPISAQSLHGYRTDACRRAVRP
ncbi:hypothetical protein B0H14DRAFT_3464379 [Mycena olivaceomarginata]|nr:hypothetical protein B0H14DRAFT_3464379 [Mycena olivaceomarginata]